MLSSFKNLRVFKPTVNPKGDDGLENRKKGKKETKSRKNQLFKYFFAINFLSHISFLSSSMYTLLKLNIMSKPKKNVVKYSEIVKNTGGSSIKESSNVITNVTYNNTKEIIEFHIVVNTSFG
jgi:thermostable 8-oxoguanine DNA glycosylase